MAESTNNPESPPTIPGSIDKTLLTLFPSEDPLDSPEFDPIQYINNEFPDEHSLVGKLDNFLTTLNANVRSLNDEISQKTREKATKQAKNAGSAAVSQAKTAINSLFSNIESIRTRAADSERMVHSICRDIRALDAAKKHLTATIAALRNLHMLVSAVSQLDLMVSEKEYRDSARLLRAIGDLFTLFDEFKHLEKIQKLHFSVENTRSLLRDQIKMEFHNLLQPAKLNDPKNVRLLADACLVVDVLEPQFKKDLLSRFCSDQLELCYGKDWASLEKVDGRYSWLKQQLKEYEERYAAVFPAEWRVPVILSKEFCRMSKNHLTAILRNSSTAGTFDVQVMIKALQKTIEFEKELNFRFRARGNTADNRSINNSGNEDEMGMMGGGSSHKDIVESIKQKHRQRIEEEKENKASPNAKNNQNNNTTNKTNSTNPAANKSEIDEPIDFIGILSEVFTPYMSSYVELEKKSIADMLDRIDREEKWLHISDEIQQQKSTTKDRFSSSDDLFLYIKQSISRCSKLTKNVTFRNLFYEYRRGLEEYANLLDAHIPKKSAAAELNAAVSGGSSSSGSSGGTLTASSSFLSIGGGSLHLNNNEIILCCFLINTAEYCNETIPALEELIKKLIEEQYKNEVNFSSSTDKFNDIISKNLQLLVANLCGKLNRILEKMVKTNWFLLNSVGDHSDYVREIEQLLRTELPLIASRLISKFHAVFCSQLASAIIPRYIESIYKCKRIGEMGAQQLRVDTNYLTTILLNVPSITSSVVAGAAKPPSKAYVKYVNTEMGKADALIKSLATPTERLIVNVKALLPKSTTDDLLRIMSLRGLKKSEQQALVDAYNQTVAPEDQIRIKKETSSAGANFSSFISGLRQ